MNLTKMDTDALGRQARYTSFGGVGTTNSLKNDGTFSFQINGTISETVEHLTIPFR